MPPLPIRKMSRQRSRCGDNAVMNLSILTAFFLFISIFALSQSNESWCWKTAMAQSEMNRCADEGASAANAELHCVYEELLAKNQGGPNATKRWRDAPHAWLAIRDAHLRALYPAEDKQREYGSIYPMCHSRVATAMTKERTLSCAECCKTRTLVRLKRAKTNFPQLPESPAYPILWLATFSHSCFFPIRTGKIDRRIPSSPRGLPCSNSPVS
jgi:uncharacterized protein YecT (DUF1311 family)